MSVLGREGSAKAPTTLDVLSRKFPPRPRSMVEIPTQSMHTNFYPNIEKGGGGIFSNILFWVDLSRFRVTLRDQLVAEQKRLLILYCRLKEAVTKSRARVYFEQQILTLLFVFHQTYNLSRNKNVR